MDLIKSQVYPIPPLNLKEEHRVINFLTFEIIQNNPKFGILQGSRKLEHKKVFNKTANKFIESKPVFDKVLWKLRFFWQTKKLLTGLLKHS